MSTPFAFEPTTYEGDEVVAAPVEEAKPETAAPEKPIESTKDVAEQTRASTDKMAQTMRDMMKGEEPKKEAAAEPEKPAEVKAEVTEEAAPKKSAEWKKVKGELETAQKQVAELNAKLEKASKTSVPKEFEDKLAAIQKERDELSLELQRAAIENHPRFKGYFDGKFKAVIDSAKGAVPADKQQAVERALKISDPDARNERLEAISEELSDLQKSRLGVAVARYDEIAFERNAELSRSGEAKTKLDEQSKAETEQRTKQTEAVFEKVVGEAMKAVEFMKPQEGDDAWNKTVQSDIELAKAVFMGTNMSHDDLARAAIWSVAGPKAYTALVNTAKELQKAQAQLAKMRVATPGVGAGGRTEAGNGAGQSSQNEGPNGRSAFTDSFKRAMSGT